MAEITLTIGPDSVSNGLLIKMLSIKKKNLRVI